MYDKIAHVMNRDYGAVDISAEDVENYLRFQDMTFIDQGEADLIDKLLGRYL